MLPMAHLTCVGHTRAELDESSTPHRGRRAQRAGAARRPARRARAAWMPTPGGSTTPSTWSAFPASRGDFRSASPPSPRDTRRRPSTRTPTVLVAKRDAGAEFAVTEMVLRASDYFGLVERAAARGVDFPIVPGIMPILNLASMRRMVELSGSEIPAEVLARIAAARGRPGGAARRGHRDRDRALRHAARGRRARPALLHAEPVQGDARDLPGLYVTRLSAPTGSSAWIRTVTVTGQGTRSVVPDTAVVRLAAGHRAADVAGALAGVDDAGGTRRRGGPALHRAAADRHRARHVAGLRRGGPTEPATRPGTGSGRVGDLGVAGEMLTALVAEVGDALRVDGVSLEVARPGRLRCATPARRRTPTRGRGPSTSAGLAGARLGEVAAIVEGDAARAPAARGRDGDGQGRGLRAGREGRDADRHGDLGS